MLMKTNKAEAAGFWTLFLPFFGSNRAHACGFNILYKDIDLDTCVTLFARLGTLFQVSLR